MNNAHIVWYSDRYMISSVCNDRQSVVVNCVGATHTSSFGKWLQIIIINCFDSTYVLPRMLCYEPHEWNVLLSFGNFICSFWLVSNNLHLKSIFQSRALEFLLFFIYFFLTICFVLYSYSPKINIVTKELHHKCWILVVTFFQLIKLCNCFVKCFLCNLTGLEKMNLGSSVLMKKLTTCVSLQMIITIFVKWEEKHFSIKKFIVYMN